MGSTSLQQASQGMLADQMEDCPLEVAQAFLEPLKEEQVPGQQKRTVALATSIAVPHIFNNPAQGSLTPNCHDRAISERLKERVHR